MDLTAFRQSWMFRLLQKQPKVGQMSLSSGRGIGGDSYLSCMYYYLQFHCIVPPGHMQRMASQ